MSQEPLDFSVSDYLKTTDNPDPYLDISYLYEIDDKSFRQLFSIDTLTKVEQQNSQNYERHYEYIYSGCSETAGWHLSRPDHTEYDDVDYENIKPNIWGEIVGSKFNLIDPLNLGAGGASVMGIVNNIVRQIRLYGAPKHIFVYFPNLDSRITFVKDPDKLMSIGEDQDMVSDICGIGDYESIYSKKPHTVEEVFTKRWASYLNLQSIILLEEICRANKINLIYSTWSTSAHITISAANSLAIESNSLPPFPNYVESDYKKSAGGCLIAAKAIGNNCHVDLSSDPRWYIGKGGTHMGVHAHIHVGETFIQELDNRGFSV